MLSAHEVRAFFVVGVPVLAGYSVTSSCSAM